MYENSHIEEKANQFKATIFLHVLVNNIHYLLFWANRVTGKEQDHTVVFMVRI